MATRLTWLSVMVGLICTGVVVAATKDAYSFNNYKCGAAIQPKSQLARARETILVNVVKFHTSWSLWSGSKTCINASIQQQIMYVAASCSDSTSHACAQCLGEAQSFLDHNCLYID